jgi:DNA-binding transcriptional ArsR family regulator
MNATLTALAEPNRLKIVELLRRGPRAVGSIAEELGLRQPQASKHLRVLSDAGVIAVQPVAQQRIYRLRPEAFRELHSWTESYRLLWEERLDRLDDVLQDLQAKENNDHHDQQS